MQYTLFQSITGRVCVLASLLLFLSGGSFIAQAHECSLYNGFQFSRCFKASQLTRTLTNSPTYWVVEFYSSWCGHCQNFVPTWKQLATSIRGWSSVVQLGQIDCSDGENSPECRKYKITGYPSIKLFRTRLSDPANSESDRFVGRRDLITLQRAILQLVESGIPSLAVLSSGIDGLKEPLVLVFEEESSMLGKMLIMEYISKTNQLSIRRVTPKNQVLVHHFSVLAFPSLVLYHHSTSYKIITGSGTEEPFNLFKSCIDVFIDSKPIIPTSLSSFPHHKSIHSSKQASFVRPSLNDITSAISYSLYMEITLHTIVSGSAFTALHRFIQLLERAFYTSHPDISTLIRSLRIKMDTRRLAGFVTSNDWIRVLDSKLNNSLLPHTPKWMACAGSEQHLRGYSCGLWSLMHTLTIITLPSFASHSRPHSLQISSRDSLNILVAFIRSFFSCEECRNHFSKMAASLKFSTAVVYDGDAVLWLWEAHNIVSRRVKDLASTDPLYPKALFPSQALCPYCYIRLAGSKVEPPSWSNVGFAAGDSLLASQSIQVDSAKLVYVWNRTAVFLYLCNYYYHHYKEQHIPSAVVLHAAWPHSYPLYNHSYRGNRRYPHPAIINGADSSLFSIFYLICFLLMVGTLFVLLKHKRFLNNKFRHFHAK